MSKSNTSLKRRLIWYGVLAAVMVGGIATIAVENAEKPPDPAAQQKLRDLRIAAALARDVRGDMKNPPSFDLVKAQLQPDGSACITFRGTNAFGAVVTGRAVRPKRGADYWVSEGNQQAFSRQWAASCSGPGEDETRMVRRMLN